MRPTDTENIASINLEGVKQGTAIHALKCFFALSWLLVFHFTGSAQQTAIPSSDIQSFGYSFLTGDTTVWTELQDDDMYFLVKALNQRDSVKLHSIKRDDLYFFGLALVNLDKEQLQRIYNDDLYFVGAALLERTIAYLENVKSDEFYFLGRAMVLRDLNELDKIKSKE